MPVNSAILRILAQSRNFVISHSSIGFTSSSGYFLSALATEASTSLAVDWGNWTFFGSDDGGRTAAILRTFIASCKRNGVEPFTWFRNVLSRIGAHPVSRIAELLPHNWKPLASNTWRPPGNQLHGLQCGSPAAYTCFETLEPVRQAVRERLGGFRSGITIGL
jgi:hypothetical protein